MRRDVYIENDSGGLSVLAADAVDDIIGDARNDDLRFVTANKVLLLELYGDDSMPVRIVVDEPLRPDEEAQWLARASWHIDTSDGRMLVMGGFDPDVLSWWKDQGDLDADGRGVGAFSAAPGTWRVDVYAHAGSMNGRAILDEADTKPGTAFRASHPGRPFPLWLAKMLEFSGEDDPGFENAWRDVRASINAGHLTVDTESGDAIGFLVHVTRPATTIGDPPESGWFERDSNARVPETFPLGLASEAPDPNLRSFRNDLLGIRPPEPEQPIADRIVDVIEVWPGDPLTPVDGGPVSLPLKQLFLLHWMAALTADSAPRFELWIESAGAWTPPSATPDFAVLSKGKDITAIGPVANAGGWHVWWIARVVAETLTGIPDGAELTLGMAPRLDDVGEADAEPAVGRALYNGIVTRGEWQIASASPPISHAVLEQALSFTRDAVMDGRLRVRAGKEREAFDAEAMAFSPEPDSLIWDGDIVHLAEPDERTMLILASKVFRARFSDQWAVDVEEDEA